MKSSGANEKKIIKRCARGDMDAFEELVRLYQQRVFSIAYNMLDSYHDADDAAQEVFIKVYRGIKTMKGESTLFTWIYRITINVCLDVLRKRKRTEGSISMDDEDSPLYLASNREDPEDSYRRLELRNEIRKAIGLLSEEMKTVIVLREIHGFSYEEIADITESSLGTVKSRIARAREQMRKYLRSYLSQSE